MNETFGKIFDWITHPSYDSKTTPKMWLLGLVLVLLVSFLWSHVVKQVVDAV